MKNPIRRCPNCKSVNNDDVNICSMCGADLSAVPVSEMDAPNESTSISEITAKLEITSSGGSDAARLYAILYAVMGAIVGIVLGYIFKVVDPEYPWHDPVFNSSLMLGIWGGTLVSLIPFHLVYHHLKNQEKTNELLTDILKKLKK